MKQRNDYKVRPNQQPRRLQEGLYDVVSGGEVIVTVQGERQAQEIADTCNLDPWHFDRGQTRADQGGMPTFGTIGDPKV